MKASSLGHHLADIHDVYQQRMGVKEWLGSRPAMTYGVTDWSPAGLACPFPGYDGILRDGWMMQRHFWDVHPMELVNVPKEGKFLWCWRCGMQVNPRYPRHPYTKECQMGVKKRQQREVAVASALAFRQQFSLQGNMLKWVKIFEYLGHLHLQDDNDNQAIRNQLQKAWATWAQVG
jgi:hypothetical protein